MDTQTTPPSVDPDPPRRRADAAAEWEMELKSVGEIQRLLLPAALPRVPGFDMAAYYRPSRHAGGDYYDVVPLVDDQWGLVVADVAGHGTAAAVIVAVMRTLIHANLPDNRDKPAGVFLERVNQVMSQTCLRDGRFVTVWCAVLDPRTGRLSYACAGHPAPRLLRRATVAELDDVGGLPLGIDPQARYGEAAVTLEAGDLLVVYTDGVTEAMRPRVGATGARELFGVRRLDGVIASCGSVPPDACIARITDAVAAFTEDVPPTDDRAMLVLRALP